MHTWAKGGIPLPGALRFSPPPSRSEKCVWQPPHTPLKMAKIENFPPKTRFFGDFFLNFAKSCIKLITAKLQKKVFSPPKGFFLVFLRYVLLLPHPPPLGWPFLRRYPPGTPWSSVQMIAHVGFKRQFNIYVQLFCDPLLQFLLYKTLGSFRVRSRS